MFCECFDSPPQKKAEMFSLSFDHFQIWNNSVKKNNKRHLTQRDI